MCWHTNKMINKCVQHAMLSKLKKDMGNVLKKKDMPYVLAQWIMWRLILSAHASGHLPKLLHCLTIQDNTMSQCH